MRERRTKRFRELRLINRRMFGRKEKSASPRWWWDPPKLVPILISSAALIISYLGWRESQRGRLINEEINRPVLALTSIRVNNPQPPSNKGEERLLFLYLIVKVKNLGKSTALINHFDLRPLFLFGNECKPINPPDYAFKDSRQILPGTEESFSYQVELLSECRKQENWYLDISIYLNYMDKGSGINYIQNFTEQFTVSPKELDEHGMTEYLTTPIPSTTLTK